MKNNIRFILLLVLMLSFSLSVSAQVYPPSNYFYDSITGTAYIFGRIDQEYDEWGIKLNDRFFPAEKPNSYGMYGVGLKDPKAILGADYNVSAYAKTDGQYIYSDSNLTINTGIIEVTADNIEEKILTLESGQTLLLEDGMYDSVELNIDASGDYLKPIVIRAKNKGKAIFSGESQIKIFGDNVVIADLSFEECLFDDSTEGPVILFSECDNSRLTNCRFITCGSKVIPTGSIVRINGGSRDIRIDNNLFKDPRAMSVVITSNQNINKDNTPFDTLIDHNYFLDVQYVKTVFPDSSGNGFECIQSGQGRVDGLELNVIAEYNRFENVTGDSSEIISNKSDGNIYRYNTFVNCKSSPCLRGGNNIEFTGNFLVNVSKGIRFFGDNINISDNYFYSSGPIYLDCGTDSATEGDYQTQTNCNIKNNIIINPKSSAFETGRYFDTLTLRTLLPSDVLVSDNVIYPNGANCVTDKANCTGITYENNQVSHAAYIPDGFYSVNYPLSESNNLPVVSGVNISAENFIFLNDLDNWWKNNLELNYDELYTAKSDETPISYSVAKNALYLSANETVDLGILSGTATYSNGLTFNVPKDKILFTLDSDCITISDGQLVVKDILENQTVNLKSSYSGFEGNTTLHLYSTSNHNSVTNDYYDYNETIPAVSTYGRLTDWKLSEGVVETNNTALAKTQSGITLENLLLPEDDFELSMDITISKNDNIEPRFWIDFGRRDYDNKKIYTLVVGDEGGVYMGGLDSRIGELWETFETDKKQNLKISKCEDTVVISVDEKIVSMAKVSDELKGKIGFGTYQTYLKIENINLYKKEHETAEVINVPMDFSRIDENTVNIKFESIGDDYIYRLYKNDMYYGDCKSTQSFTDITVKKYKDYIYKIEVYDIKGMKIGEGELNVNISDSSSNDFFKITDVQSRSGENGEYITYYESSNRFLDIGTNVYCDRTYKYLYVSEKFKDSGYIETSNNDRYNEIFKTACDDWLTFNINRSATVYVITYISNPPDWLKDWNKEENTYFDIAGVSETYVYSKYFPTEDGVKTNVKLGGFTSMSSMYQVVVKPDVMPEKLEIIRK